MADDPDKLAILHEEFLERLEVWEGQEDAFPRALRWYLLTGTGMGFTPDELATPFVTEPTIARVIAAADQEALLQGRPRPGWHRGAVVTLAREREERQATVVDLIWNQRDEAWDYYLLVAGERRRCRAGDLLGPSVGDC